MATKNTFLIEIVNFLESRNDPAQRQYGKVKYLSSTSNNVEQVSFTTLDEVPQIIANMIASIDKKDEQR